MPLNKEAKTKLRTFLKESTIHGVPKIVASKIHLSERIFWIIIIGLAIGGSIALALQNLGRYYANPTVVALAKDYRNWFNPFPAATACFHHKTDEMLVDDYISKIWGVSSSDEKYDRYQRFVEIVAHLTLPKMQNITEFEDAAEEFKSIDLFDLVISVHPEVSGTLLTFDSTRDYEWTLVMTELGVCFSMNTKIAKLFTYQNDTETMNDPILSCHYLNGLCYARFDSDPLAPFKAYIHSFYDIAHATSEETLEVLESQELEVNFNMQETSADEKLRTLSPAQRKCRFDDEPINHDLPAYSTSICYILCRARKIMELCGCRPYFYHNLPGKQCDFKGMLCVAKHHEDLIVSPLKLGCRCPQPCHFITYLPQTPKVTVWEYGYFDQRITFRWELLPPTTKYHRGILFGFEDLVVSIGGTLALFLGVSFITAFEVFYNFADVIVTIIKPPAKLETKERMFPLKHRNNFVRVQKRRRIGERSLKENDIGREDRKNVFYLDAPVSYYTN